mmetsp:Transcript_5643/g.14091  ORF Transcript_5643/g.14091 Transcript_5643/m.14091 type:complete len:279 (-) Transcript_5643:12-848(-)
MPLSDDLCEPACLLVPNQLVQHRHFHPFNIHFDHDRRKADTRLGRIFVHARRDRASENVLVEPRGEVDYWDEYRGVLTVVSLPGQLTSTEAEELILCAVVGPRIRIELQRRGFSVHPLVDEVVPPSHALVSPVGRSLAPHMVTVRLKGEDTNCHGPPIDAEHLVKYRRNPVVGILLGLEEEPAMNTPVAAGINEHMVTAISKPGACFRGGRWRCACRLRAGFLFAGGRRRGVLRAIVVSVLAAQGMTYVSQGLHQAVLCASQLLHARALKLHELTYVL